MARSHPPSLQRLIERCLLRECGLRPGARLLVGVSGGPDSMALLHVLARLAPKAAFEVIACGVDHGLRPEAARELSLAEEAAAQWGVAFERRAVSVAPGGNLQARARAARYGTLRRCAAERGAELLAIAHHRDDRAETVLLRLLRGAGPRGLAVLPARSGDVVRPMIHATRSDIERHLARHGVPFAEDPSNRDARFLRARVRHELLPLLRELSPGVVDHLAALAEQLAETTSGKPHDGAEVPCPRPADASVQGVPLNREQAAQLRAALPSASGRPGSFHRPPRLWVPLSGQRVLTLDPASGQPSILSGPLRRPTAGSRRSRNSHPAETAPGQTLPGPQGTRRKQERG